MIADQKWNDQTKYDKIMPTSSIRNGKYDIAIVYAITEIMDSHIHELRSHPHDTGMVNQPEKSNMWNKAKLKWYTYV